ncbi:MAG: S24 family peptidase [Deltaproteobacteria bacterium]|nr:S24 family peptidase [Deltaproteobacteria bacterium]
MTPPHPYPGYDPTPAVEALRRLKERTGSWADLGRRAGLTAFGLRQNVHGNTVMSPATWDKLFGAFPGDIPAPPWARPADGAVTADGSAPAGLVSLGPLVRVVVFDANCGQGIAWTDGGMPVGEALDYDYLPASWLDENSFVVRIHNDSMADTLLEGDRVLVVPGQRLFSGDICFAAFPQDGDKLVKRFRKIGETVVLESDNKAYPPIVLTGDQGREVRFYKVTRVIRDL